MSWVLVFLFLGFGRATAVIPGYHTQAECEYAATHVPNHERDNGKQMGDAYYCVPGPTAP